MLNYSNPLIGKTDNFLWFWYSGHHEVTCTIINPILLTNLTDADHLFSDRLWKLIPFFNMENMPFHPICNHCSGHHEAYCDWMWFLKTMHWQHMTNQKYCIIKYDLYFVYDIRFLNRLKTLWLEMFLVDIYIEAMHRLIYLEGCVLLIKRQSNQPAVINQWLTVCFAGCQGW